MQLHRHMTAKLQVGRRQRFSTKHVFPDELRKALLSKIQMSRHLTNTGRLPSCSALHSMENDFAVLERCRHPTQRQPVQPLLVFNFNSPYEISWVHFVLYDNRSGLLKFERLLSCYSIDRLPVF